jgi:alpha-beta hydrolase superfamily lysophospholipase
VAREFISAAKDCANMPCVAEKVSPWLERQLADASQSLLRPKPKPSVASPRLILPGTENFTVEGRPASRLLLPSAARRANPQPWIFYAPTLLAYPDEAERWMHEQFLAGRRRPGGCGEGYGSPKSHALFDALYRELTEKRGFGSKPCLFGRSRGVLWVSSWAIANPNRVAGIIGIYPVFDPHVSALKNAAPLTEFTPAAPGSRAVRNRLRALKCWPEHASRL